MNTIQEREKKNTKLHSTRQPTQRFLNFSFPDYPAANVTHRKS